jgi:hypothetical protein
MTILKEDVAVIEFIRRTRRTEGGGENRDTRERERLREREREKREGFGETEVHGP